MDELDTTDVDGTETDYLATSSLGYGYGYTKRQALTAMVTEGRDPSRVNDTLTVDLVEHVGDATAGPTGWEVETLVSAERVEIDAERLQTLRSAGLDAHNSATRLLDEREVVESTE